MCSVGVDSQESILVIAQLSRHSRIFKKKCDYLAQALILFSEGTRPAGEGACRKNAHHRGALEVLQKIYSLQKILIPIL